MENMIPPSYEEATTQNHWDLVAAYIPGPDLCAACLVCRRWHQIFAPWLWGDPASHFGKENDRVYVALTRFKRALPTASLGVRQLTLTLHLPPAQSEIYNGPKSTWLRDVLEQLPNLQSLIVAQLPFFDHSSLLALRYQSRRRSGSAENEIAIFPLRLLIASKCSNVTANSLVEVCLHLPHMVYLDLSFVTAARDPTFLYHLRLMRNLQILKLQNIGLRDEDLERLAASIGVRIRSLDLSNNRITDSSIDMLLEYCFQSRDIHAQLLQRWRRRRATEDWPPGISKPNDPFMSQLRSSDMDNKFLKHLTKSSAARTLTDDLPQTGITHLYLSGNCITAAGLRRVVQTENLCVLDGGCTEPSRVLRARAGSTVSITTPGKIEMESLAPALEQHGSKNLSYLRLHHTIVTKPTEFASQEALSAEIDGLAIETNELDATGIARAELDNIERESHELDSTVPVYELAAQPVPCYELPAAESLAKIATSSTATQLWSNNVEEVKSDAAYAPEVAQSSDELPITLTATGFPAPTFSPVTHTIGSASSPNRTAADKPGDTEQSADNVEDEISQLERQRRELRRRTQGISRGLLPGALPSLRALVLTEIPVNDNENGDVIANLKKFIADCALESRLAMSQANLEFPRLHVPGKPRYLHKSHRARELFGLSHLILEMSNTSAALSQLHRASSHSSNGSDRPTTPVPVPRHEDFHRHERSSTGDPDSEAFWHAQQNDFTFFGDEECGLPAQDPNRMVPRSMIDEKMTLNTINTDVDLRSSTSAVMSPNPLSPGPDAFHSGMGQDVVAELARWRREQKEANRRGGLAPGYWKGEVKIVRPALQRRPTFQDNWY